jgi:hypothetical protein
MRTIPGRWIVLLIGVILIGCSAGAAPHKSRKLTPATTQVSTEPRTLKFADVAQPIEHFQDDDHDIDLRNVIHFEGKTAGDVYFGQCDRVDADGDPTATVPLIVARAGKGTWGALSLADPRLPNAEFQFVATGPEEREVWGVLDDTLTGRGRVVMLVHSTDAGATWTITPIEKPFDSGEYDSFAMDASGRGRMSVYVAPTRNHPRRAGFYHFRTSDGGKTWSSPEHEPDAMDPADEVPSDEEPEPLKSIPTQTASTPLSLAGRGPGRGWKQMESAGVRTRIDSARFYPHPNPLPAREREQEE